MILATLFICFFLSGSAALLYEVVWMRMLTQIFGSSAYAIATLLAAFMAGLALGSYIFGRLANSARNLLRLYGILELGIGIYGLLVPVLFRSARGVYIPLFWLYDSYPTTFNLLLFLLSFVLLIFPTFLMGATLPVLSRFFVRSFSHLGQRIADLYATNTLGAVLGCALTGYYLIPALGMSRTVHAAAMMNLVIALLIFVVDGMRAAVGVNHAPCSRSAARQDQDAFSLGQFVDQQSERRVELARAAWRRAAHMRIVLGLRGAALIV